MICSPWLPLRQALAHLLIPEKYKKTESAELIRRANESAALARHYSQRVPLGPAEDRAV
jgi:hypothetical protein